MKISNNDWLLIGLGVVVMLVIAGIAGVFSVFYADTGLRTITTQAGLNNATDELFIEYSLGAARSDSDYSQSMMMFVKLNDEWLSADSLVVRDRSNYVRNIIVSEDDLLAGENTVEFYFKSDRSHPTDTEGFRCWTSSGVRSEREEFSVDRDVGLWTVTLLGGGLDVDSVSVDGVEYGILCGFAPRGGFFEGSQLDAPVYVTNVASGEGDPGVLATTLRDVMDEQVGRVGYTYDSQLVYVYKDPEVPPPPPPKPLLLYVLIGAGLLLLGGAAYFLIRRRRR